MVILKRDYKFEKIMNVCYIGINKGGEYMKLQESGENYLETILMLHNKTGFVRSIDIANAMGFSKPSVSHAVGLLKKAEYIVVDSKTNQIILTDEGKKIAEGIYERHCILASFFKSIGVSEEVALADACKIEHDISQETFEKIKEHINKK